MEEEIKCTDCDKESTRIYNETYYCDEHYLEHYKSNTDPTKIFKLTKTGMEIAMLTEIICEMLRQMQEIEGASIRNYDWGVIMLDISLIKKQKDRKEEWVRLIEKIVKHCWTVIGTVNEDAYTAIGEEAIDRLTQVLKP